MPSGLARHEVQAWVRQRAARVLSVRDETVGDLVRRQLEERLSDGIDPSGPPIG